MLPPTKIAPSLSKALFDENALDVTYTCAPNSDANLAPLTATTLILAGGCPVEAENDCAKNPKINTWDKTPDVSPVIEFPLNDDEITSNPGLVAKVIRLNIASPKLNANTPAPQTPALLLLNTQLVIFVGIESKYIPPPASALLLVNTHDITSSATPSFGVNPNMLIAPPNVFPMLPVNVLLATNNL